MSLRDIIVWRETHRYWFHNSTGRSFDLGTSINARETSKLAASTPTTERTRRPRPLHPSNPNTTGAKKAHLTRHSQASSSWRFAAGSSSVTAGKDAVVTKPRRPQLIYLRGPALRLHSLRQGRAPPYAIPPRGSYQEGGLEGGFRMVRRWARWPQGGEDDPIPP